MLSTEAFNALLKTLEEPPPHVMFIFATTEPHKIPTTILSRCQRYDFKLMPARALAEHLARDLRARRARDRGRRVGLIAREAGGSVRDALSLLDQVIAYVGDASDHRRRASPRCSASPIASLTRTLVEALAAGDAGAALAAVEAAIERGVDEVQLARAIVRYLRDLAVLQVAPGRASWSTPPTRSAPSSRPRPPQIDRSRVTQMFERMLRCCDELARRSSRGWCSTAR